MSQYKLSRFFGGSPLPVLLRLMALSLVVGVVLSALNLHPLQLIEHMWEVLERIYYMGFDALGWAVNYFLLGAMIVFPVWVVMRVLKVGKGDES